MEISIYYEFVVPKNKEVEIITYLKEIRKNTWKGTLVKQDFEIEDYNTVLLKFQNDSLCEVRSYISSHYKNVQPKDFSLIKVRESVDFEGLKYDLKNMYPYVFSEDIKSIESMFLITIGSMKKRLWRDNSYYFVVRG